MISRLKECLMLFCTFFRVGAFTFGGGYAMLPILRKEFVEEKGWIDDEEMLDYMAIGQSTPGIIAVNMATFIGFKRQKLMGAIFATTGIVMPSLIIITIIAAFIRNFTEIVWVQKALKGINVAVAVILCFAVFELGKKAVTDWIGLGIAIVSFVLVAFFSVDSIWIIIASAVMGILIKGRRRA